MVNKAKTERATPALLGHQRKAKVEEFEFVCEWVGCDFKAVGMNLFNHHVASHRKGYTACLGTDKELEGGEYMFYCQWQDCGAEIAGEIDDFSRHVFYHSFHQYLKLHGKHVQSIEGMGPCNLGNQSRNVIPELPEKLQCRWQDCDLEYDNPYIFYAHVVHHCEDLPKGNNPNVPISCKWEGCNANTKTCYKMKEHLRSHTQAKVVACPTCGALFANNTKFIDHLKRLKESSPTFECTDCHHMFGSERTLRDHMRHHVNHYKCPMCDMTTYSPSALREHIRYRHSNDRQYQCKHCDYRCKSVSDQRRHQHYHCNPIGGKKCCIPDCHLRFETEKELRMHQKKDHVDRPRSFQCHVCHKNFTRGAELSRHLVEMHAFRWPSGHNRFRYRLQADGYRRLQTVRYESIEVSEEVLGRELTEHFKNDDDIEKDGTGRSKILVDFSTENATAPFVISSPSRLAGKVNEGQPSSDETKKKNKADYHGQTLPTDSANQSGMASMPIYAGDENGSNNFNGKVVGERKIGGKGKKSDDGGKSDTVNVIGIKTKGKMKNNGMTDVNGQAGDSGVDDAEDDGVDRNTQLDPDDVLVRYGLVVTDYHNTEKVNYWNERKVDFCLDEEEAADVDGNDNDDDDDDFDDDDNDDDDDGSGNKKKGRGWKRKGLNRHVGGGTSGGSKKRSRRSKKRKIQQEDRDASGGSPSRQGVLYLNKFGHNIVRSSILANSFSDDSSNSSTLYTLTNSKNERRDIEFDDDHSLSRAAHALNAALMEATSPTTNVTSPRIHSMPNFSDFIEEPASPTRYMLNMSLQQGECMIKKEEPEEVEEEIQEVEEEIQEVEETQEMEDREQMDESETMENSEIEIDNPELTVVENRTLLVKQEEPETDMEAEEDVEETEQEDEVEDTEQEDEVEETEQEDEVEEMEAEDEMEETEQEDEVEETEQEDEVEETEAEEEESERAASPIRYTLATPREEASRSPTLYTLPSPIDRVPQSPTRYTLNSPFGGSENAQSPSRYALNSPNIYESENAQSPSLYCLKSPTAPNRTPSSPTRYTLQTVRDVFDENAQSPTQYNLLNSSIESTTRYTIKTPVRNIAGRHDSFKTILEEASQSPTLYQLKSPFQEVSRSSPFHSSRIEEPPGWTLPDDNKDWSHSHNKPWRSAFHAIHSKQSPSSSHTFKSPNSASFLSSRSPFSRVKSPLSFRSAFSQLIQAASGLEGPRTSSPVKDCDKSIDTVDSNEGDSVPATPEMNLFPHEDEEDFGLDDIGDGGNNSKSCSTLVDGNPVTPRVMTASEKSLTIHSVHSPGVSSQSGHQENPGNVFIKSDSNSTSPQGVVGGEVSDFKLTQEGGIFYIVGNGFTSESKPVLTSSQISSPSKLSPAVVDIRLRCEEDLNDIPSTFKGEENDVVFVKKEEIHDEMEYGGAAQSFDNVDVFANVGNYSMDLRESHSSEDNISERKDVIFTIKVEDEDEGHHPHQVKVEVGSESVIPIKTEPLAVEGDNGGSGVWETYNLEMLGEVALQTHSQHSISSNANGV